MIGAPLRCVFVIALLGATAASAAPRSAAAPAGRHVPPATAARPRVRPHTVDAERRLDVNQLGMYVTNYGMVAYDGANGGPGLDYPNGSGNSLLYAAGLWIGAHVDGVPRVTVAEYTQEYAPGAILPGGLLDNPLAPANRVYKVVRWTGNPEDSAHVDRQPGALLANPFQDSLVHDSWSEYLAGAAPQGAPVRVYRLPDTDTPEPGDSVDVLGPDVRGDQMLWSVYNDGNPANHAATAGGSDPLDVEVQQTVFAFDRPGPLGASAFVQFKIVNRGPHLLQDVFAALWCDPDIGGSSDDLAGCDSARSLAYAYNGGPNDIAYGSTPPAVGVGLLAAPANAAPGVPLQAFNRYVNGEDPAAAAESYAVMTGLARDGSPQTDPVTGDVTRYPYGGDPANGIGWIDARPSDRRLTATAAPFTLAPGDSATLTFAIEAARGASFLGSLAALRAAHDFVRQDFAAGFALADPGTLPGATPLNCPRAASWWQVEGAAPLHLAPGILTALAAEIGRTSGHFAWTPAEALARFRATIEPPLPTDARTDANREYLALLANVTSARLGLRETGGDGVFLNPLTPVSCAGLTESSVASLVQPVDPRRHLRAALYVPAGAGDPAPLAGVDLGFGYFGDGAGYGERFTGSTLDSIAQRDSFATVEIRFDPAHPQKAYRYLRLEVDGTGAAPPQGRGWLYGGFQECPFTVWDTERQVQLDAAFVERALTSPDGLLLPPGSQPATQDSVWDPDTSATGGREFLLVLRGAYSGAADPVAAQDGAPGGGGLPVLYVLAARQVSPAASIAAGDRFRFEWGHDPVTSLDADLLDLAALPLSDPAVAARYADLAACALALNQGIGVGPVCDAVTPVMASLARATASDSAVEVAWQLAGGAGFATAVARATPGSAWATVAQLLPDGTGRVAYVDHAIEAGRRYGYRLTRLDDGRTLDEVWVDVPARHALSLAGFRPNPAQGLAALAFTLPVRAPATLDVIDVAGRRVAHLEVGALGPGTHVVRLDPGTHLAPGVYLAVLRQGTRTASTRAVLLR